MSVIRLTRSDELQTLRDIEVAAGAPFRDLGMESIASAQPPPVDALAGFLRDGALWVSADERGGPRAYLSAQRLGRHGHIEQVSVQPAWARRGIGAQLIEHARRWASSWGARDLTLTTFLDVPWNAPYYRRLGFVEIAPECLDEHLLAVRRHEAELGLDEWPRIAMSRPVAPDPTPGPGA